MIPIHQQMQNNHMYSPYDIGESGLQTALSKVADPALLTELVGLSRSLFGWFNKRHTRCDEYVWIAKYCRLKAPIFIADIGARVSPLPIFLANQGHQVLTIDHSRIQRIPGCEMNDWNGWGYLDYSKLSPGVSSLNISAVDLPTNFPLYDLFYSVSVVEHLPAQTRRLMFEVLYNFLRPGGDLMLTVDLVPGTEDLWNFDQGRQIELATEHGDLFNFLKELQKCGFKLVEVFIKRDYLDEPKSDVGFIHCRRDIL